jgi:acyl-coenzyme A thioesterase 13
VRKTETRKATKMNNVVEYLKKMLGLESNDSSPSPFGAWLNGRLLALEALEVSISFDVRKKFTNLHGNMHGGATAGIMDETMGMTLVTMCKQGFFVATNSTLDFPRPSKLGDTITANSKVVRVGKVRSHVVCEIVDKEWKILSKASSNLIKTGM